MYTNEILIQMIPWAIVFSLGIAFFYVWLSERRKDRKLRESQIEQDKEQAKKDRELRERQVKIDWKLAQEEEDRQYEEKEWQHDKEKRAEEDAIRAEAGFGTGGYIVFDLPDEQRALFQDMLKGFEDYARLKGYSVSFSVDSTFKNRIVFKFTLSNTDKVVATDRIRQDLKEYLDHVRRGDSLDDIPVVIPIEEHELVVATLKIRINFLEHNYNMEKNTREYYEGLMRKVSSMSVLPAQNIVLKTDVSINAPTNNAMNSPHALVGESNRAENSIQIAGSFNERKEQIRNLDELLVLLRKEPSSEQKEEVIRNIGNIKDELQETEIPDTNRIAGWLNKIQIALQIAVLSPEVVTAVKGFFSSIGIDM